MPRPGHRKSPGAPFVPAAMATTTAGPFSVALALAIVEVVIGQPGPTTSPPVTITLLAALLNTRSRIPAVTVVGPVYPFAPVSVSVPAPTLVTPMAPLRLEGDGNSVSVCVQDRGLAGVYSYAQQDVLCVSTCPLKRTAAEVDITLSCSSWDIVGVETEHAAVELRAAAVRIRGVEGKSTAPTLVRPPPPLNACLNVTALLLVSRIAESPLEMGAMPAEMSWVFQVAHWSVPPPKVIEAARPAGCRL